MCNLCNPDCKPSKCQFGEACYHIKYNYVGTDYEFGECVKSLGVCDAKKERGCKDGYQNCKVCLPMHIQHYRKMW